MAGTKKVEEEKTIQGTQALPGGGDEKPTARLFL